MTPVQEINAEAKSAFDEENYSLAFRILWKSGVSNFLSYAQKEEGRKTNWFTHARSGVFFWNDFILKTEIFNSFFESAVSEQILHHYFFKNRINSEAFETRLASKFPQSFIKAVRVNQAFLNPDQIDRLCSIQLAEQYQLHSKIWRKIFEIENSHWNYIQTTLVKVSELPLVRILSECVIWLESHRFNNNSKNNIHFLARVYSFFIELFLYNYPSKEEVAHDLKDFFPKFLEVFFSMYKHQKTLEESPVSNLLNAIGNWINFNEQILSPYSFDLNVEPTQEYELVMLSSTPESHYAWLLNGARYEFNQLNYFIQGSQFVEQLEAEKKMVIPKGKSFEDEALNRILAQSKWSTLLLLSEMGIESFTFNHQKINIENLLSPLIANSFNRLHRYEKSLQQYSATSQNWFEAFLKLQRKSFASDILLEPFFLMTGNDYKKHNQIAAPLREDSTEAVIHFFSYSPNRRYNFNRFNRQYEVWQKPFVKIGEYLFCPLLFFSENIWFYSFAQAALLQRTNRSETRWMENYLGEVIRGKGWTVKVINDEEANAIDGDVDIIVDHNNTTLFIQLKRTYFRLELQDAFYESMNTDKKGAKQLNEAEIFFQQNNSLYTMRQKPFKWIVSTSFENVGGMIDGCSKINYFELLNALKNPEVVELTGLISDMESDINMRKFVSGITSTELSDSRQIFSDVIDQLSCFGTDQYRRVVFTQNEEAAAEYNSTYDKAINLRNEGKLNDALILIQRCVQLKPKDVDAFKALANILAEMGLYESSIIAFKNANEIAPNDPSIIRDFSLALIESGKIYEGLSLAVQLLEDFPLLIDIRLLFTRKLDQCIRDRLLNPEQLVELHSKWNNLN